MIIVDARQAAEKMGDIPLITLKFRVGRHPITHHKILHPVAEHNGIGGIIDPGEKGVQCFFFSQKTVMQVFFPFTPIIAVNCNGKYHKTVQENNRNRKGNNNRQLLFEVRPAEFSQGHLLELPAESAYSVSHCLFILSLQNHPGIHESSSAPYHCVLFQKLGTVYHINGFPGKKSGQLPAFLV
jgi:hypothetical protein